MKRSFRIPVRWFFLLFLAPKIAFALPGILEDESFKTARQKAFEQYQQHQFQEALEYERIAYRIALERYGPTHPYPAAILDDLAQMQRNIGQYGEAEKNLKWGLALREKAWDPGDPRLADPLERLVDLYQDMGRYEEAYSLELRAVKIRKEDKGLPGYGPSLNRLGLLEMELGKNSEAQNTLDQTLALVEKKEGTRSLALVEPLRTRADLSVRLKNWEGAQKDLEKVLEIYTNFYTGFGYPTADAMRALGDFFNLRKMGSKSKSFYERALNIY